MPAQERRPTTSSTGPATASALPRRRSRLGRFLLAGLSGVFVNQAALWLLTDQVGVHYVLSAALATGASTTWNFALIERWVYRADSKGRTRRFLLFAGLNVAWLFARAPLLVLFTEVLALHYLLSNLLTIGLATLTRFWAADVRIWGRKNDDPFPFRYSVHDLVRVASAGKLPELEAFRVRNLEGPADIEVRIGGRGLGRPRLRTLAETGDHEATYVEQLGALGFAFKVQMGTPIRVQASRLLARSPHVLYTNVVEPVLRWTFVRKGAALIHAACLELDGKGLLITAKTDTGKTTTCLRCVHRHDAAFLSDDMVILHDGVVLAYPKPLTISAHTLTAVKDTPLPRLRRVWLGIQGRVHSRSGRRFGMLLAKLKLPVGTMNAILQILVPPPKFHIRELEPEARTRRAESIDMLCLIERGDDKIERLGAAEAANILMENTEDAYGFPPYPLIKEGLHNGDEKHERATVRMFLRTIPSWRVRVEDRNWEHRIVNLLEEPV